MYLTLVILPLLGSIVSGFFGRKVGSSGSKLITSLCVILTTMFALVLVFEVGFNNIVVTINLSRWLDSEFFNILWDFRFDALTVYFGGLFYIEIEAVLVLIQQYKKIFIQKSFISPLVYSAFNLYILYFIHNPINNLRKKVMNYSIQSHFVHTQNIRNSLEKYSEALPTDFLEWFVGFTDAEGNFSINRTFKKDKLTISSFSFTFKIGLHKDDEKVLRYIKGKLGIGGVRLYKDECIFNVTDQKGIELLILIFDKYNLNTSKHLDYLDFKEAFLFYLNRDKNLNPEAVKDEILKFKNKMNTNRVHFDRPDNSKIVITNNWLLGFTEGDGSFFLRRDNLTPIFSIENTGVQLPVLVKIKEFLENSLGFDKYSLYKLKNTSTIAISTIKARSINGKSSVTLIIKNINVLNNYLIPLFSDLKFLTKKGKDFYDFKIICNAVYEGLYRKEEIRSLILKLSNTMNNFRLSTYKGSTVEYLSPEEMEKLLYATPTVKHLLDGRVIDSNTKKILPRLNSCVYEIWEENENFFLVNSLNEAALTVGVYPDTLSKYLDIEVLDSNKGFVEVNQYKVRRVCVFKKTR